MKLAGSILNRILALALSVLMALTVLQVIPGGMLRICAEEDVAIDETTFPDDAFRQYVEENCDADSDGMLSDTERQSVKALPLSGKAIESLQGIEYFTALVRLNCSENLLTSLDLSENTDLQTLNCADNRLTSLDLSGNTKLTYISCTNNCLACLNLKTDTEEIETSENCEQVVTVPVPPKTDPQVPVTVNLKDYDPSLNTERIQRLSNGTLDTETGIVTFEEWNGGFMYQYQVNSVDENAYIIVTVCDADHIIQSVDFNVKEPTAGKNPAKPTASLSSPISVHVYDIYSDTGWAAEREGTITPIVASDTFEEGERYRLSVSLNPNAGYAFAPYSEIVFLINGKEKAISLKHQVSPSQLDVSFQFIASAHSHTFGAWTVEKEATAAEPGSRYRTCTECGFREARLIPRVALQRIYGDDRYGTSMEIADALKSTLCRSTFDTFVIASGSDFPDALAGAYLAIQKQAPLLIVSSGTVENVASYVRNNSTQNATVYILGGPQVVPTDVDDALQGYNCRRLYGQNRYGTCLEILQEAGLPEGSEILVCSGTNYADALAASATGCPILLVPQELTEEQKEFLHTWQEKALSFTILGGTGAVSSTVEKDLKPYGPVERVSGRDRYETASVTAKHYFSNPCSTAVLAYGLNFTDGLCGGPLAYACKAPIFLMTDEAVTQTAPKDAAQALGVDRAIALGGPSLISDESARNVYE